MSSVLVYLHPLLAAVTLALAWVTFRQGFHQRRQRLRGVRAPEGSYARHVQLGPWAVACMVATALGGVLSAVLLRDWKPLGTAHGWLGTGATVLFVSLWWLGRGLRSGDKARVALHGVLGLLGLFAAGLTGVLGIALLP